MRVFAIHDAAGNISEVVTSPEDTPPPVLTPQPGLTMTEIEAPTTAVAELDFPESHTVPQDQSLLQDLVQIAERYRVEVAPGTATLVQRHD